MGERWSTDQVRSYHVRKNNKLRTRKTKLSIEYTTLWNETIKLHGKKNEEKKNYSKKIRFAEGRAVTLLLGSDASDTERSTCSPPFPPFSFSFSFPDILLLLLYVRSMIFSSDNWGDVGGEERGDWDDPPGGKPALIPFRVDDEAPVEML